MTEAKLAGYKSKSAEVSLEKKGDGDQKVCAVEYRPQADRGWNPGIEVARNPQYLSQTKHWAVKCKGKKKKAKKRRESSVSCYRSLSKCEAEFVAACCLGLVASCRAWVINRHFPFPLDGRLDLYHVENHVLTFFQLRDDVVIHLHLEASF